MTKQTIYVIVLLCVFAFANIPESNCSVVMMKAKRVSDSVIFSKLGREAAEKFYQFNSKKSLFPCGNDKMKVGRYPRGFTLVYELKGFPINCETVITLDSTFKVEDVGLIAAPPYLQPFISKSDLRKILKKLNAGHKPWLCVGYDSTEHSSPVFKPFIELRHYVRTISQVDEQCLSNIDSCLAIDPYNGKVLKWYYSDRMSCF